MIYFGYNSQALQWNRQAPCVPDTGKQETLKVTSLLPGELAVWERARANALAM